MRHITASAGPVAPRALTASGGARSPDAHYDFEDQHESWLASLVPLAFVPDLRRQNARALCSRIPNEIWVEAWQYLSLLDRFRVSQVCSSWRILAKDSPRLWCNLHAFHIAPYADNGSEDCDCEPDDGYGPCVDLQVGLLDVVSQLSGDLPLTLDIGLGRYSKCLESQLSLLDWVLPRLHFLHVFVQAESAAVLGCALELFSKAVHLRKLEIFSWDPQCADTLWPGIVNYPALERMEIKSVTVSKRVPTSRSLPSLKTLRFAFESWAEVQDYLQAAPRLCDLSLDWLGEEEDWFPRADTHTCDEIRQRVHSISRVAISGVSRSGEKRVIAMFHLASRTELLLGYGKHVAPAQLDGIAILAHIVGPVRLSLTQDSTETQTVAIQAVGTCGRTREIRGMFSASQLVDAVSKVLPSQTVNALVIDLDLCDALQRCQSHWPDITSLTIRLPRFPSVGPLFHGKPLPRAWLELSTARLEAHETRITWSPVTIRFILRVVHLPSDLDTLVLSDVDGITHEALSGLARTVIINGRRVSASH